MSMENLQRTVEEALSVLAPHRKKDVADDSESSPGKRHISQGRTGQRDRLLKPLRP